MNCSKAAPAPCSHKCASEALPGRNDGTALVPYVECVFRHLVQHARFYRSILGKQGDPLFRALFQELLSELIFGPITAQNQVA